MRVIRGSLLLVAALLVGLLSPPDRVHAQQPAPGDTSETNSPLADSLQVALDRFEAASPPAPADSADSRRWADSVQAMGNRIRSSDPTRARALFRQSLRARRALEDSAGTGPVIGDIGVTFYYQSRYEEALARLRGALEIQRKLGDRQGVAITLVNIGGIHYRQGRYEEALTRYRKALAINREIGDRPSAALSLRAIGELHLERSQVRAATDTLRLAVRGAERLRRGGTSPEARRSLLSTQIDAYQALTAAYVRTGELDSALRSTERARARLLADRLAGAARSDTALAIPSVDELRQTLGPEEAALLYLNAGSDWPLAALAVTADTTYTRELPDSTVRREVGREYPIALSRLRREEGPMKTALQEGGLDTSGRRATTRPLPRR